MAIVSRGGGGGGGGGGDQATGRPQEEQPVRTNLPPRTGPVIGRRPEMEAIAMVFNAAQQAGRTGRVEIVGKNGVGATTVAVELARRAGGNFPGGAWYLHLGMGTDLAWADLAVVRGAGPTQDLSGFARAAREELASGPRALLVVDGVESAEQLRAALPENAEDTVDVIAVSETSTGVFDDVVEVTEVPSHGARRIAHSITRIIDEANDEPPLVRSLDGLAVTASLAARASVQYHRISLQQETEAHPLSVENVRGAVNAFIPLIHETLALDVLLLASVAHPVRIPIDALFEAEVKLREGQGKEAPTPQEVGGAVLNLVRLGMADPCDDRRITLHPMVQEVARSMMQADSDRMYLRFCFAAGLISEAEEAIAEEGVDLGRTVLHHLRFLATALDADLELVRTGGQEAGYGEEFQERVETTISDVRAAITKLEAGLGIGTNAD